jgi:2-oxoglutarate dehydrogenase E1 component
MAAGEASVDWSAAEALAIASLAVEGTRVRLSGQDSGRGTFSQRHALLSDSVDGHRISIFDGLAPNQGAVEIINSPLCEAGTLGFEYGFSLEYPDALVMWEAQFGDFVNAAQVIIDQFIASAEDKWERLSGLVMLLPHGFEGQGPEHSSARLERFLALAAEDNMQIVYPSTPAQYFHVLRRQVKRPWRKPLIVLTPKSLLRHRRMASPLAHFTRGTFARILVDERVKPRETSRVLLASGKVAFDLLEAREELGRDDVAILRVEQLYPLSDKWITAALRPFADGTPVIWVQEEPANMGAWPHMQNRFGGRIAGRFPIRGITRPASASPATGSSAAHKAEQQELIERSFNEVN